MNNVGKEVNEMPGFDGTGPAGSGPMTGGARGWCNPYQPRATTYDAYRPLLSGLRGLRPAFGSRRPLWGWSRRFGGRGRGGRIGRGRVWRW